MSDKGYTSYEEQWEGPSEYQRSPLAFLGRLRFRITALVMLTVIPLLLIVVHSTMQRRDAATEAASTEMNRLARVTAQRLEEVFTGAQRIADRVRQTDLAWKEDPAAAAEFLAGLRTGSPFTADIRIVGHDGAIHASALPAEASKELFDASVVDLAVRAKAFAVGDFRVRDGDHPVTVDVALPMAPEDPTAAPLVSVTVDAHALKEFQRTFQLPSDTTLEITDPHGVIRAQFPDGTGVGEKHPVVGPGGPGIVEGEGGMVAAGVDGVERFHGYQPIVTGGPVQGTGVTLAIPVASVTGPVEQALRDNLIWTLVITVLAVLAVEILAGRLIVQRVNGLILATKRVAATPLGEFHARDRVSQDPSELGDLERAFDEMAHALQAKARAAQKAGGSDAGGADA